MRVAGVDPALASLALTQVDLRARAAARLGDAFGAWLWTPASLEQATRPHVAARRATRVAAFGARRAADLGCGAGADTIALALAGLHVTAYDLDPDAVTATRHNADIMGVADLVTVHLADARAADLTNIDVAMIDPARRDASGRRLMRPHQWSPTYAEVLDLATRVPSLVAKLAPGIDHGLLPPASDTEWVQDGTDLVEATLWLGALSTHSGRSAVLVSPTGELTTSERDLPSQAPTVGEPGAVLYEPEPAVIRAGLVGVVAAATMGWLLDPAIAYVTAANHTETPLATSYDLISEVPFAVKKLRAELQARGYGNVIIKKRGVALDPEELRRSLRLQGNGPTATLVMTRTERGPLALLVEPRR